MSLQPMHVYERFSRGASVHDPLTSAVLTSDEFKYRNTREFAASAFKLNAQIAAELYYQGTQNVYDLRKHFGSLRLPYPAMWIEWQTTPTINLDGAVLERPNQLHMAALLTEVVRSDIGCIEIAANLFMASPGLISVPKIYRLLRLDMDGNYLESAYANQYPFTAIPANRTRIAWPEGAAEMPIEEMLSELNVAWLAVSLMHCRNVTTEGAQAQSRRSAKKKGRRCKAGIDYHTIVLPGSNSGGTPGECADVMAMHRARGHFKTYTAEAPLMGKHVGTYWWGWQVRGNKKNGTIVTDYKVGAA